MFFRQRNYSEPPRNLYICWDFNKTPLSQFLFNCQTGKAAHPHTSFHHSLNGFGMPNLLHIGETQVFTGKKCFERAKRPRPTLSQYPLLLYHFCHWNHGATSKRMFWRCYNYQHILNPLFFIKIPFFYNPFDETDIKNSSRTSLAPSRLAFNVILTCGCSSQNNFKRAGKIIS